MWHIGLCLLLIFGHPNVPEVESKQKPISDRQTDRVGVAFLSLSKKSRAKKTEDTHTYT